jgi:hypothetical protein
VIARLKDTGAFSDLLGSRKIHPDDLGGFARRFAATV